MADERTDDQNENRNQPEPGSDEYNRQMAEKFENQTPPSEDQRDPPPVPVMPEGGHEKFYNKETGVYDWQAHAKEAEFQRDQARKKSEKPDDDAAKDESGKDDKTEDEQREEDEAVKDIVERAGLTVEDLANEIIQEGGLSDEHKDALVKQGVPEKLIDEYVENAKFRLEHTTHSAIEYIGGQEAWEELHDWAAENLDDADKDRINKMLRSPDWKDAIDILKSRQAQNPRNREGRLRQGDFGGKGVAGYQSRAEMIKDVQSDRYRTDPAFRAQVQKRMAVSNYGADGGA